MMIVIQRLSLYYSSSNDGKQPSMKVDYDDCNTTSLSLYYSSSNDGKQPSMKVDYDDCNTASLSLY